MQFLVYDDDGRIIQANKLYDKPTDEYIDQMKSIGRPYVTVKREKLINPDAHWIKGRRHRVRPTMGVAVSKSVIKAGGADTTVLTWAPPGCQFHVDANIPGVGIVVVHSGTLPDGELEIGMDVPCLFTIHIKKWPFQDFSVVIEAAA